MESLDQSIIKTLNRSRILRAFRENEIIQKKELADALRLSITTVTTNTNQLLEEGLIEETGIAESTGGRKPVVFQFLKNAKVTIGVDISPHQVKMILSNLSSEVIDVVSWRNEIFDMDKTLEKIEVEVNRLLERNHYLIKDCLGIGLSLPGLVDAENNRLVHAPNLVVKDYDFSKLQSRLGMKIFMENEANVAAFAELILGAAENNNNAVYVSITEGVGCGIISDHKVAKGTYNKAGEFGHMRISDRPLSCSCGRSGCWELFSSERALLRIYEEKSGVKLDAIEAFFEKYHEGSSAAIETLKTYLDYLLVGVENIMLGLDPEVVIIGGDIVRYLREFEPMIEGYLEQNHTNLLSRDNKLVLSSLAPQSALLGAALLPLVEMFGY